jgi:hypothetical protein
MTFEKDFKEALSFLPDKEKDKLILRLLKKDKILAERLYFEMVSPTNLEDKRSQMEESIKERTKLFEKECYSVGYLNMDIRFLSGDITEHVKITKDKFGEASLNLLLLMEVLKHNNSHISKATPRKFMKIGVALIARAYKILVLIDKLDQDYLLELEENLKELGRLIGENPPLMKMAIFCGLDVNWFIRVEIPENISDIYKHVRAEGYLSAKNH